MPELTAWACYTEEKNLDWKVHACIREWECERVWVCVWKAESVRWENEIDRMPSAKKSLRSSTLCTAGGSTAVGIRLCTLYNVGAMLAEYLNSVATQRLHFQDLSFPQIPPILLCNGAVCTLGICSSWSSKQQTLPSWCWLHCDVIGERFFVRRQK